MPRLFPLVRVVTLVAYVDEPLHLLFPPPADDQEPAQGASAEGTDRHFAANL
jgi:hypothetical protein